MSLPGLGTSRRRAIRCRIACRLATSADVSPKPTCACSICLGEKTAADSSVSTAPPLHKGALHGARGPWHCHSQQPTGATSTRPEGKRARDAQERGGGECARGGMRARALTSDKGADEPRTDLEVIEYLAASSRASESRAEWLCLATKMATAASSVSAVMATARVATPAACLASMFSVFSLESATHHHCQRVEIYAEYLDTGLGLIRT